MAQEHLQVILPMTYQNISKIKTLSFDNSAHLTCFANDYGFENWVGKQLGYADKNDLVILLSASGKSKNDYKCLEIL